jgi:hypothetical protein
VAKQTRPKNQLSSKEQSRRSPDDFVSIARRLECDEDKGRFEKKLGKMAHAKRSKQ